MLGEGAAGCGCAGAACPVACAVAARCPESSADQAFPAPMTDAIKTTQSDTINSHPPRRTRSPAYTLRLLVSVPASRAAGQSLENNALFFATSLSQVLTVMLHTFDFRFGDESLIRGDSSMPKDDWFLISVPLVIFLAVMIAAA